MNDGALSPNRILTKLDEYLHKNDYASAERHLNYWLSEAQSARDERTELLLQNERMGLYRKLGKREQALECVSAALRSIEAQGIAHQVGAATTLLNCATVYKAFAMADDALPLFEAARAIYEKELDAHDERLGGLYNNMGLCLVDLRRFEQARELYRRALSIMEQTPHGAPEAAITYLNLASAAEAELGAMDADEIIEKYLQSAEERLESVTERDGNYAFVCEKCASVFDYYGHFFYANELKERARRIYGR